MSYWLNNVNYVRNNTEIAKKEYIHLKGTCTLSNTKEAFIV